VSQRFHIKRLAASSVNIAVSALRFLSDRPVLELLNVRLFIKYPASLALLKFHLMKTSQRFLYRS
jgi:hypothetical protein